MCLNYSSWNGESSQFSQFVAPEPDWLVDNKIPCPSQFHLLIFSARYSVYVLMAFLSFGSVDFTSSWGTNSKIWWLKPQTAFRRLSQLLPTESLTWNWLNCHGGKMQSLNIFEKFKKNAIHNMFFSHRQKKQKTTKVNIIVYGIFPSGVKMLFF